MPVVYTIKKISITFHVRVLITKSFNSKSHSAAIFFLSAFDGFIANVLWAVPFTIFLHISCLNIIANYIDYVIILTSLDFTTPRTNFLRKVCNEIINIVAVITNVTILPMLWLVIFFLTLMKLIIKSIAEYVQICTCSSMPKHAILPNWKSWPNLHEVKLRVIHKWN